VEDVEFYGVAKKKKDLSSLDSTQFGVKKNFPDGREFVC